MTAYPDWAAGEIVTAAKLQGYTSNLEAICRLSRDGVQGITDSTLSAINFSADDLDPRDWHSTGVNPNRVTPDIAGWYEVTFEVRWANDTDYTALRQFVAKNGATGTQFGEFRWNTAAVSATPSFVTVTHIELDGSTDYVEGYVSQSNTNAAQNNVTARFAVKLLYPT